MNKSRKRNRNLNLESRHKKLLTECGVQDEIIQITNIINIYLNTLNKINNQIFINSTIPEIEKITFDFLKYIERIEEIYSHIYCF